MDELDEKTSFIVKVVVMPTFLFVVWIALRSRSILIGIIGKRAFASHLITIITRYDMLVSARSGIGL